MDRGRAGSRRGQEDPALWRTGYFFRCEVM